MTPTLPKQFAAVHNGLYRAPPAAPGWRDAVLSQSLYWATLDLSGISTKKGFLGACAQALQFPAGLGGNWDALADCLEDLSWLPSAGVVMHWRNGKAFASACEADAALARTGGKAFVPSGVRTLSGHRKEVLHVHAYPDCMHVLTTALPPLQVLHVHAYADHVASCSGDGHVLVWSVAHSGAELLRRWTTWGASCVRLDAADQLTCGGEGTEPITVYNWRTGAVLST